MNNSIRVITPYKWNNFWVFDDLSVGLIRVGLIDVMLDRLTESFYEPDRGFNLIFSSTSFPGFQLELKCVREDKEHGGNWYYCEKYNMEGWLCPTLDLYFDLAPTSLFIQAKPIYVGD